MRPESSPPAVFGVRRHVRAVPEHGAHAVRTTGQQSAPSATDRRALPITWETGIAPHPLAVVPRYVPRCSKARRFGARGRPRGPHAARAKRATAALRAARCARRRRNSEANERYASRCAVRTILVRQRRAHPYRRAELLRVP